MIRYSLRCAEGHKFDSWFQSAGAYDGLAARGLVACAICGSDDVAKAMMAPRVAGGEGTEAVADVPDRPLSRSEHPAQQVLRAMREHVEKHSTYVGGSFAREARAMHLGDTPQKPIHGEANRQEAEALIEDGVPILPLPMPVGNKPN